MPKINLKEFLPLLGLCLFTLLNLACSSVKTLKPLGKNQHQIDAAVGGPFVTTGGMTIPVPYAVAGYAYGLNDKLNVQGSLHITTALYKTFGAELGVGYEILRQDNWIPEIFLDARAFIGTDIKQTMFMPILTPVLSYEWAGWSPYIGIDNAFVFDGNDRWYSPQALAPLVGLRARVGGWQVGGEFKWLGANHDFTYADIERPTGLGNHGALAPYLYVNYKFGPKETEL